MVILGVIIGIMCYRRKQSIPKDGIEEETGVDENSPEELQAIEESPPVEPTDVQLSSII